MNALINEYLRAFVIGSSFIVFLPFIYSVSTLKKGEYNYSYKFYSVWAPFSLGVMNMVSLFLARQFDLTPRMRYLVMGLLGATITFSFVKLFNIYNRINTIKYGVFIYSLYFFVFNVILYNLDQYV